MILVDVLLYHSERSCPNEGSEGTQQMLCGNQRAKFRESALNGSPVDVAVRNHADGVRVRRTGEHATLSKPITYFRRGAPGSLHIENHDVRLNFGQFNLHAFDV